MWGLLAVQVLGLGRVFGQGGSGNGLVTSGLDPRVNPAMNLVPRPATAEEQMPFERSRMENRWLRRESNAFGRLDQGLINDERAARQSRERLDEQRKGLTKFLNGLDSARNAAAFRKSIQQLEQTTELATLLGTELPSIDARHFGSTSKLFGMVRQDGSLETPPQSFEKRRKRFHNESHVHSQRWWSDALPSFVCVVGIGVLPTAWRNGESGNVTEAKGKGTDCRQAAEGRGKRDLCSN